MREEKLSRRAVLQIVGAVPIVAAIASACGGKSEPDSCADVSALSEAEKTTRTALQYVDTSPQPDKKCSLCNLFVPPPDPSMCGTCQVVKGPIHPGGYCTSWVKKAAS